MNNEALNRLGVAFKLATELSGKTSKGIHIRVSVYGERVSFNLCWANGKEQEFDCIESLVLRLEELTRKGSKFKPGDCVWTVVSSMPRFFWVDSYEWDDYYNEYVYYMTNKDRIIDRDRIYVESGLYNSLEALCDGTIKYWQNQKELALKTGTVEHE